MTPRDCIVGIRQKVSDTDQRRWPDDNDFLPMMGRALVAIFRKRPDSVCVDNDTLPLNQPTAPATLDDEMQLRVEYQEALELYVSWILWNQKGSDKQISAKADAVYKEYLAEVSQ